MIVIRMRRTQQSHQYSKKYTIHNSKFYLKNLVGPRGSFPRGLLQFFQKAFWIAGKCEIRPRELSTASQPVNSLRCLFSFWNLFSTFVCWLINTWTDFWCKHILHNLLIIKCFRCFRCFRHYAGFSDGFPEFPVPMAIKWMDKMIRFPVISD